MKLALHKPLWGHRGGFEQAVSEAVEAGFDGIEGPPPSDPGLAELLERTQLSYIAEVPTGGGYVPDPAADPRSHLEDLARGIEQSRPFHPRFITTQAGLDAWPFPQQVTFFEDLLALQSSLGISILVETHRSRPTFSPWSTRELLREVPGLRLTCDFSHWCCVAERLVLDEDEGLLHEVADRCDHMHLRIGYDQGPQVPDPRDPLEAEAVEAHWRWWEVLWENQAGRQATTITATPEFGPDRYLHEAPYTREPVADLWEVNRWMADEARSRFASWVGTRPA